VFCRNIVNHCVRETAIYHAPAQQTNTAIMFTPFKLSRELLGHSKDVRAVTVLPSGHIVTGSRDNTIKIWNPDNPSQTKTLSAHQNFVGSLTSLTPTEEAPTRIFASGGNDKVICVWDISADIDSSNNNNNSNTNNNKDNETAPINFMLGHDNSVSSLSATVDGDIISGSWDKYVPLSSLITPLFSTPPNPQISGKSLTLSPIFLPLLEFAFSIALSSTKHPATLELFQVFHSYLLFVRVLYFNYNLRTVRIWKYGACVQELKGHEHAVWSVLGLPNGDIATASADSTIKIWRGTVGSMQCIKTMKSHKDCVRGLALIPGIGFVSCANDETLMVWSMGGDLLQV
jgi:WD40 repeat protein